MNIEFKKITQLSMVLFAILILIINLQAYLNDGRFIPQANRTSQVTNTNQLRAPRLNHSSEFKKYPDLKKQSNLTLVANAKMHKVFVINNHRVIYILHAQVHATGQQFSSQGKTGQQVAYIDGNQTLTAENWTEFGHHFYFASPTELNQQTVKEKWLKSNFNLPGCILLSKPDALWIQSLPKGTKIIIR